MKRFIKNKNLFIILFLIIVLIPAIFSLLHTGFFSSDDGEWMIIRFSAFHEGFRDGQIPVRFLGRLNNGFGYPVANFLYPAFMYLAEPIHILGFNFVNTIKIVLGLSIIASAIFTFLWLSKIFDKFPSFLGSIFYIYVPYHLFDLYRRGSVGEILALAIIPFILWQTERRNMSAGRQSSFWISVGSALLILSHNTLAILFIPLLILYAFIRENNGENIKKIVYRYVGILAATLGLSSFFWIPAVFELSYTQFASTQISDFRNYFAKTDLIGISSLLVIFLSAFIFIYRLEILKKKNISPSLFMYFMIIAVLSIGLSSKVSLPLWNITASSFIQFPFRFLSYLILAISFLAAYIVYSFEGLKKTIFAIILIFALLFSAYSYLTPTEFFDKSDPFYSTNEGTTTVADEYMPKWVKVKPVKHFKNKVEMVEGNGVVKNLIYNSNKLLFNASSLNGIKVRVNTIYYPGWNAYVDGEKVKIDYSNDMGLMDIFINEGNHNVSFTFSETPLRLFADIISILSLGILIIYSAKNRIR